MREPELLKIPFWVRYVMHYRVKSIIDYINLP